MQLEHQIESISNNGAKLAVMLISLDQVQINHLLKIGNFALLNIVDTNKGVLTDTKHLA